MAKNIIFDFGNVLGQCYSDALTGAYVADVEEKNIIRDVVFDRLYWDRLDRGTITDDEVIAGVCSRLPEQLHCDAITVYENWINTMTPVPGMFHVVSELKEKGHKIYLLSNISKGFAETYPLIPWIRTLFSLFDGLVFSGVIGMAKPDQEIFQYVLDTFHLDPKECVFIDDRMDNVNAAKKTGIEAYFFNQDVNKLREFLELPQKKYFLLTTKEDLL